MSIKGNSYIGFSMVELAISLLIISLAIIPIIVISRGSASGQAGAEGKLLSHERAVASSLMEKAVGSSPEFIGVLEEYNVFNQKNDYEIKTQIYKDQKTNIHYRWILRNVSYSSKKNERLLPDGNYLIDATLEVFYKMPKIDVPKPSLILGSKILIQKPEKKFEEPAIGIMFVVDMTPSMSMSNYGWGHNPIAVIDPSEEATITVSKEKYPIFAENTPPEKVINYIYNNCNVDVSYDGSFGTPHQKYKNEDDFAVGSIYDNPKTDFDERYKPSMLFDMPIDKLFGHPLGQSAAKEIADLRFTEFNNALSALTTTDCINWGDSAISRIEMVRSGLYTFVNMLEKEEAGPSQIFKIGFLPFAGSTDLSYLLPPAGPDKNNSFTEFKKYVKSINRDGSPINYSFKLTENQDYTTDIETALRIAHRELIKDKSLNHRIIILVTDWNHCVEIPKVVDVQTTRGCIKQIILGLQEEEKEIIKEIERRMKEKPGYKLPPNDPLAIRLKEILETKTWLIKFIPEPIKQVNNNYQPFHEVYDASCRTTTESPALNMLAQKIAEGKINNAHGEKTDLYIFGIVDAARPPAVNILANMTTSSENGEFLTAKRVHNIITPFVYLVLEMNRITKLLQAKRYIWNKNNGRKN